MARSLLRAALAAADRGWPVFPVRPGSKRPAIRDWPNRATTNGAALVGWWSRAAYNIGIACGPAGLVVLDLDLARGAEGPEPWTGATSGTDVLRRIADAAGESVPITYEVATPSRGTHLYFRCPPNARLRNTTAALGWRIDTRGAGGYVLAAGSVLRVRDELGHYRVRHDIEPASLPPWIEKALRPAVSSEPATQQVRHPGPYVRAVLHAHSRAVAAAPIGTRNDALFRAAARLSDLVAAGHLDHQHAADALRAAAAPHHGVAGFTEQEAARTIASGLRRGELRQLAA